MAGAFYISHSTRTSLQQKLHIFPNTTGPWTQWCKFQPHLTSLHGHNVIITRIKMYDIGVALNGITFATTDTKVISQAYFVSLKESK